jgi:hypothetical protein
MSGAGVHRPVSDVIGQEDGSESSGTYAENCSVELNGEHGLWVSYSVAD